MRPVGLDDDLIAYYDAEARAGIRERKGMRVGLRRTHADVLRRDGARTVLDVGAGPGLDTIEFDADGFDVIGLDLAPGNVAVMTSRGLRAVAGSLYRLPFADATFDAVWTMSTFVHVPAERRHEALGELRRVVRPGGTLAIGTWGGRDYEGVPEFGEIRPRRFFSLASHDRWREAIGIHGRVEHFETFEPTDPSGWEYQFAVVRRTADEVVHGAAAAADVQLRAARAGDTEAIAGLWHVGWADGHRHHVPDALLAQRTFEQFRRRVPDRLATTTVATIDGQVVGFVIVIDDEIEQIYVDRDARGTGIAAALLEHGEGAIAVHHPAAWLAVVDGNARARAFYERRGWHDAGPIGYEAEVEGGTFSVPCRRYEKIVAPSLL